MVYYESIEIEFVSGGGVIEEVVVTGSNTFGGWYSSASGVGAESYATEQSIYEAEASVDQYLDKLLVVLGGAIILAEAPPAATAALFVGVGLVAKDLITADTMYRTGILEEAGYLSIGF